MQNLAPGLRVLIRDAEWIVKRVDAASDGGHAVHVTGVSDVVRDREAVFLTRIEDAIEVLDPARTALLPDTSPGFRDARLYIEALLRRTPPADGDLCIGHRAAMDLVDYQLQPALQALDQPRQRILLADAVGLGKTLEAGILLSELIRRGRGKRILVITMKSMLTQFQKEMWSRFTIPLVRLDSVGIQRIRGRIPANHNPFYYYDRSIISIDTLKQDHEYRTWLEQSRWDVIVIDEAHAVAHRGTRNLRHRLARLLAERSDALIMLTATPHDGKPRSFASLMNMLDPTAIADPDSYTREDIRGLFIRRHKKDVRAQVLQSFRPRTVHTAHATATPAEEAAFEHLASLQLGRLDRGKGAGQLFRTTLEKSLLSSPVACAETLANRIRTIQKRDDAAEFAEDMRQLAELQSLVDAIGREDFSKYARLLELLRGGGEHAWDGGDAHDRLVIFTERIATLRFLEQHLPKDLGLAKEQVDILHGGLPDVEQNRVVEDFGRDNAPVRLLLASDVASEGINLHYLSHRMIHFDIPWSLIRFQQRNGRVDRYGQQRDPRILYLLTDSTSERIRGDRRIMELLIEKDQHVHENIGDPVEFTGLADVEDEERLVAVAVEKQVDDGEFSSMIEGEADVSLLEILMGGKPSDDTPPPTERCRPPATLFPDDMAFLREAVQAVRKRRGKDFAFTYDKDEDVARLQAPDDLLQRYRFQPGEILPATRELALTTNAAAIQEEVARCRQDEEAWPKLQYLWELHPVMDWLGDGILSAFRRGEAPVLALEGKLDEGESIVVISCLIPNRRGQTVLQHWCGVRFRGGKFGDIMEFDDVLRRTGLSGTKLPNTGAAVDTAALEKLLPEAVKRARAWMQEKHDAFDLRMKVRLTEQLERLGKLREKKQRQLEQRYGATDEKVEAMWRQRRESELRRLDRIFTEHEQWVRDVMTTESTPYVRVAAVVAGLD
ncbi:MAG: DEAD/DEAH box helicase [Bacteroidetes bacterium]|nr:DEAD/DEAH box helicase [Bacteroidota bacterium]